MIAPYEKAVQLMESFNNGLTTKDCALISVVEIIEAIKYQPYGLQYVIERDYWEEVKEELENL